jgi:hypothetical protein
VTSSVPDPHPDPLVRGTDTRIRIRIRVKITWIPNTAFKYIFHEKILLSGTDQDRIRIGLALWIRICIEIKSWIRIRRETSADPQYW